MNSFVKIFLLYLIPAFAIAQKYPNDIVKAHDGVPIPIAIGTIGIKVETKEGEGSEFIILLPG